MGKKISELTPAVSINDTDEFAGEVVSPNNTLSYAWSLIKSTLKTYFDTFYTQEPAGTVKMYLGASAPTGFLLCNGQAVSRTTYSDLFTLIGTNYGVGDGSTTFNVPDYRGMFLRGAGTNGTLTDSSGTGYTGPSLHGSQDDAMQKITGSFSDSESVGIGAVRATSTPSGVFTKGTARSLGYTSVSVATNDLDFDNSNSTSPNTARTDDAETRPANYGVNYIIKF